MHIVIKKRFTEKRTTKYGLSDGEAKEETGNAPGHRYVWNDKEGVYICSSCNASSKTAPASKIGDVDGDGKVTSKDALLIKRHVAGFDVEFDKNLADVDGDDQITSKDALLIKRYVAGFDVPELS